jgi:hypothetical protein
VVLLKSIKACIERLPGRGTTSGTAHANRLMPAEVAFQLIFEPSMVGTTKSNTLDNNIEFLGEVGGHLRWCRDSCRDYGLADGGCDTSACIEHGAGHHVSSCHRALMQMRCCHVPTHIGHSGRYIDTRVWRVFQVEAATFDFRFNP